MTLRRWCQLPGLGYWQPGWIPRGITYSEINGRPIDIGDLNRDVNVSYWYNDIGYLTEAALIDVDLDAFGSVEINSPQDGQLLIYRDNKWINDFGPPANISFNSIGDLGDVTYTGASAIDPGTLTVESMGTLAMDSPQTSGNLDQQLVVDDEYGLGVVEYRTSDQSGTGIYASRGRGVTLRSDVNYVRLTGDPDIVTNRPELRFETGDFAGDNPTGQYIGFKMPNQVDENVLYYLPPADGDTGDILATDGFGNLAWVAQAATSSLGQLSDVDLSTFTSNGGIIQYNEAADIWMVGSLGDLASSLDDLSDVSVAGINAPADGESLTWNQATGQWEPAKKADAPGWTVTASNSSSYTFSGSGIVGFDSNPDLYVVRGQKYTFTKTVSAHPFQLQETPGLGQPSYTSGLQGQVPLGIGNWTWEVPLNAPTTLYYQCTAHESMQGTIHVLDESGTGGGAALTVQAKEGSTGTPTGVTTEVSTLSFNSGNGFSVTDLGNGEAFVELGSSFAPWYVDGQATLSPAGEEPIKFIAGDGVEITTNPNAAIKEITFTATGGGGGGGGAGGALDAGRSTETVTTDASGHGVFTNLGHSGVFVDVSTVQDCWVTFYVSSASRTADASRDYGTDPAGGSGVLAEYYVGGGTILSTPGIMYYNGDTFQTDALYVAARTQTGTAVTTDVTVTGYAHKNYTGISGGTFGSG